MKFFALFLKYLTSHCSPLSFITIHYLIILDYLFLSR